FAQFTYSEEDTGNPPYVNSIKHYDDSEDTFIVRISRKLISSSDRVCYEQKLLIRVVQGNGNVIEIDPATFTNIQDVNYCLFSDAKKTDPLRIYPLFGQYILVTYVNASNTSDNTTFRDMGMVIDWTGQIKSELDFGPSYLTPNTTHRIVSEKIVNNINPLNGFSRLSMVSGTTNSNLSQFEHIGNGNFNLLKNNTIEVNTITYYELEVFSTLNGGYAIVFANTTKSNTTNSAHAGIYAIFLNNQTNTPSKVILYESPNSNLIFNRFLVCSVDYVSIGHSCIIFIEETHIFTNITTNSTTNSTNINTTTLVSAIATTIRFLSSGAVIKYDQMSIPDLNNLKTLSYGGYVLISRNSPGRGYFFNYTLYGEDDSVLNRSQKFSSNVFGAFDVLKNNTMLIALNETSETSTSWDLTSIDLPRLYNDFGYGNLQVNSTDPPQNTDMQLNSENISITFKKSISLSDGNINIFQTTGPGKDILRQRINSKICSVNYKCFVDNSTVKLSMLQCTFNDPGGKYYIQIDNNFVEDAEYKEPLLGISPNKWIFNLANDTSNKKHA
ncbi:5116_t:CDS:2, partial [Dentiscutata heterogama]